MKPAGNVGFVSGACSWAVSIGLLAFIVSSMGFSALMTAVQRRTGDR